MGLARGPPQSKPVALSLDRTTLRSVRAAHGVGTGRGTSPLTALDAKVLRQIKKLRVAPGQDYFCTCLRYYANPATEKLRG